jgi:hypothetical protein
MITPLLTLSYDTLATDDAFTHPYLVRWDLATLGDADAIPWPRFALCVTPLPAFFCTCGRYLFCEPDDEDADPW